MSQSATISAFVICMNEENQIRRCLESISWCDEIIIIDSGSTDRTLDICKEYTSKIFQRPWPGFVAQKQFGLDQCTSEWILNIDADEEVTHDLKLEIKELLSKPVTFDGFELPRVVNYLGGFWRKGGWYPEFRLRLCRRAKTRWGGSSPHERAIVDGPTMKLKGELHHYTYSTIASQVRSLNSLSSASATTLWEGGVRASLFKIVVHPVARFIKFYLIRRGYREGFRGFVVALIDAFGVLLKYVKLWEKEHFHS